MKIIFTLTDGAGIRNFIHTGIVIPRDTHKVILLCNSSIISSIKTKNSVILTKLPSYTSTILIEVLRGAISIAELIRNAKKFNDPSFLLYLPNRRGANLRLRAKDIITGLLGKALSFDSGIQFLRRMLAKNIQQTDYYNLTAKILQGQKPDLLVCTHQRSPEAAAVVVAARVLNIPTVTYIFSWDNLPKGTLIAEADQYFVWSDYMKRELLKYYPWINEASIHVTGSPQFLPYFDKRNYIPRELFASKYGLELDATWICFSGDDEMTSPYDPLYLKDLAKAVNIFNAGKDKIQIVFRPSPADFSSRYDEVIEEYKSCIRKVPSDWIMSNDKSWGSLIPLKNDYSLLCSIAYHCSAVFNVGSTMAIDFSIVNKPSAYFRYNVFGDIKWNIHDIYRFVHFNTMSGYNPVYWLDSPKKIHSKLNMIINDEENKVSEAKKWQEVVVKSPLDQAGDRIWSAIELIMQKSRYGGNSR